MGLTARAARTTAAAVSQVPTRARAAGPPARSAAVPGPFPLITRLASGWPSGGVEEGDRLDRPALAVEEANDPRPARARDGRGGAAHRQRAGAVQRQRPGRR